MDSWKFRDELLKSLNQWYLILGFILLGGALGFAISYLAPAPYQAVSELYVGIDVVRVNQLEYLIPLAEEEPLNLDDYKNWQLKQVADVLTTDRVLNNTLAELYQAGFTADDFVLKDLRKAIDIYWYDTGTWRLEVVLPDKEDAVQVVNTWMDAGHAEISRLLEISKTANAIDQKIWSDNLAISEIKLQRAKFRTLSSDIAEWIERLGEFSGTSQLSQELYTEIEDWLEVQIETAGFSMDPFTDIPTGDGSVETFIQWFEDKKRFADEGIIQLEIEKTILEADRDETLPEFHQYLTESLGFSANLVLLPNTSEVELKQIYSTDNFAIGGSLLGFFAWIIFTAVQIGSRKENNGK